MDLDVDDFGCVADGRFLEEVSLSEGSAVLTALGGGLRLVDVGKQVAVPGAADLVAVIADLVDRLEVLAVSMAAGSKQLTGTLVDPVRPGQPLPFRKDLHVGRRITVAGAGPAAAVLLSGIHQVVDATTVILDDAASITVSGVEVIVNDPARVGFVVSRAVGSAVVRNRVRRRLRHLARGYLGSLPGGSLLVVRANPRASTARQADLAAELDLVLGTLLRRQGRALRR